MHQLRALTCAVAFAASSATAVVVANDDGPIGQVRQPITVGDPVTVERQRELGLVTVGGGCSGTLLNRYWVLTADHCVASDGDFGGPDAPFASTAITASWSAQTVIPTRYVRYWNSNGLDVALVFLGDGDFGNVPRKLIFHLAPEKGQALVKFGQGICAFAFGSGPTATPAQSNCGYRTALFEASEADETRVVLRKNSSGQVGNGGDSGGPDYHTDGLGNPLSIVSVQSTCAAKGYVAGQPSNWQWATDISHCTSAALYTLRDQIAAHLNNDRPPDRAGVGQATQPPIPVPYEPSVQDKAAPLGNLDVAARAPNPALAGTQDFGGLAHKKVYGRIGEKYSALGGRGGALGAALTDEADAPYGGRFNAFQHGYVYWHPKIGEAFAVWGSIGEKWNAMGRVDYGYPITDERTTPDGRGRFNHFRAVHAQGQPESSIYWTPQTGAHAVYGLIREAWAQQGWERGPLGYPTSDEHQDGKFRRVNFEHGHILWAPDTGIQIRQ